eukprot:gene26423-29854_t
MSFLSSPSPKLAPWKVLLVDDEPDIHDVTKLTLSRFRLDGRALSFVHAYSGAEAKEVLAREQDIALVFLDVVMEQEDSGLEVARWMRQELDNQFTRIVLRTGQPGQAPEERVIVNYDINDYKAKTELTTQKLFTTVISALRAYESLNMLERSRVGLGKILAGATNLYQIHSLREFASGVLNQVSAILDVGADGVLCLMQGENGPATVVAATGHYAPLADNERMPPEHPLWPTIAKAFAEKKSQFDHPANVLFIHTQEREVAISVTPPWPLAQIQRDLAVEVGNAAVPALQKHMIKLAREHDKVVITATQMMESMIVNAVPTRAEVSDVANAVLDGTDAVMTSAETASGKYPIETVEAMAAICLDAEKWNPSNPDVDLINTTFSRIDQSIAYGALFTAHHLRVKAIAALTESGSTCLWMSRNNIDIPIIALTPSVATQRKLALYRNVQALELKQTRDREVVLRSVEELLVARGIAERGDTVVLTWGEPMGLGGGTNALKIMKLGAPAH